VVRLTIDDDLTSTAGLAKAIAAVSDPRSQVLFLGHCLVQAVAHGSGLTGGRARRRERKYAHTGRPSRSCLTTSSEWPPHAAATGGISPWNGHAIVHTGPMLKLGISVNNTPLLTSISMVVCSGCAARQKGRSAIPSLSHGVLRRTSPRLVACADAVHTPLTLTPDSKILTLRRLRVTLMSSRHVFIIALPRSLAACAQGGT